MIVGSARLSLLTFSINPLLLWIIGNNYIVYYGYYQPCYWENVRSNEQQPRGTRPQGQNKVLGFVVSSLDLL